MSELFGISMVYEDKGMIRYINLSLLRGTVNVTVKCDSKCECLIGKFD